jgi:hypothetical protein
MEERKRLKNSKGKKKKNPLRNLSSNQKSNQQPAQQQAKLTGKRKRNDESSEDDDDAEDNGADEIVLTNEGELKREGEYTFDFSDMKNEFYNGIHGILSAKFFATTGISHDFTEIITAQGNSLSSAILVLLLIRNRE